MKKTKKKSKPKVEKLTVWALKCPTCLVTIYSRAHHDYHGCDCKNGDSTGITIDGGFEYLRYGWGNDIKRPEAFELKLNVTRQELYDDWNLRTDKYGWIRNEKK